LEKLEIGANRVPYHGKKYKILIEIGFRIYEKNTGKTGKRSLVFYTIETNVN